MEPRGTTNPPTVDEDLLVAVVESAPDGIVIVDGDGAIRLVNSQLESMFGYERHELVGRPVEVLLPERYHAAHVDHRRGYQAAPRTRPMGSGLDLAGRRRDGSELPVDVSLSPLTHRGEPLVIALVRDVTERRMVQQRLAHLAAIVSYSDDAIYSVGRDGAVTSWNRAAARLYGVPIDEILGEPVHTLAAPHREDEQRLVLARVLAGERVERLEIEHRRRDGLPITVSLTVSPIVDAAGEIVAASVIARDITEQRLVQATLTASEARLRESELLAEIGSWLWDVGSDVVQWSEGLHAITQVAPENFDGDLAAHLSVVHPSDRDVVARAMRFAVERGARFEHEFRIVRPGGEERWVIARGEPVHAAAAVVALQGIFQDVTERRAAERLKDDFLATVSHELRTPLTAIVGFSDLLARQVGSDLAGAVQAVVRNAREMDRMVSRLLDFSRLQAGREHVAPEARDAREAVEDCLALLRPGLDEHTVANLVPDNLVVEVDTDALQRVLGNLVGNAAKFAPAGSTIEVDARPDGDRVVFTVADRGPGLPDGIVERVFDRFFQGPDQPAGKRGTGVGLSIVQRYVELHGGRVWAENRPGGGAVFAFTLRRAPVGGGAAR